MKDCNNISIGSKMGYLNKLFLENVRNYSQKVGLNFTYSKIIMILNNHKDGLIQNDLVEQTYCKASTISLTLKNMEYEGYITRENCKDDNRKIIVRITDKGIEFDKKIRECFRVVENNLIFNITLEELDIFNKVMNKMKDNLDKTKGDNK